MSNDPIFVDGDLPETARAVAKSIEGLTTEVSNLNTRIDQGRRRTRTLGLLIAFVFLIAVFDIGLTRYFTTTFDCIEQANRQERVAQIAMLDVVLDPTSSADQRQVALRAYRDAQRIADQQRTESNAFTRFTGDCS